MSVWMIMARNAFTFLEATISILDVVVPAALSAAAWRSAHVHVCSKASMCIRTQCVQHLPISQSH